MKNNEVAYQLLTIANLLDIKGEGFFKTRAYRMAAQKILDLNEDIEKVVEEDRIEKIPGIGKALSKKISEYIQTGQIEFLNKLGEEIPSSVLDFLDIPSLGPKKVAVIFNKLHITTIEELKKSCKKQELQHLDGFGPLTEINILRGIALIEKIKGRNLLHHATNIGEKIISYIQQSPYINKISLAGSLRRRKETIGDIDILVSSDQPDEVMKWFVQYPSVNQIIAHGKTKSSILLNNHIQIDLRVVDDMSFGAALQYFTGSKEHNVSMRGLALKRGFTLNEYGLFSKDGKEKIAGENEEDIYHSLNLPFIPPEIRENRGEVELGLKNNLPSLLDLSDIKGDLHVHSTYSDGHDSIERMVNTAEKMGYEYIGIADHSQSLHVANGLNEERILQKADEIKKLNKKKNIKIFLGTECDIKPDGTLDYSDDQLDLFDYIGLGIHSTFKMTEKQVTERIIHGISHPSVLFLAHPTCRLIGNRDPIPINMERLFEAATDTNTALEINSFPDRLDLNDIFVKRAKEIGVKFCIGTDAHAIEHLSYLQYGVATARRGWLEKKDVINTSSVKQVVSFFR